MTAQPKDCSGWSPSSGRRTRALARPGCHLAGRSPRADRECLEDAGAIELFEHAPEPRPDIAAEDEGVRPVLDELPERYARVVHLLIGDFVQPRDFDLRRA